MIDCPPVSDAQTYLLKLTAILSLCQLVTYVLYSQCVTGIFIHMYGPQVYCK